MFPHDSLSENQVTCRWSYADLDNTEVQDSNYCHACIVQLHADMLGARGGIQFS